MAKFRKKPVVVEAIQFGRSSTIAEARAWAMERANDRVVRLVDGKYLEIETLEGTMRADEGDWIIQGVQGELYPCKPDIFEATYEPVP